MDWLKAMMSGLMGNGAAGAVGNAMNSNNNVQKMPDAGGFTSSGSAQQQGQQAQAPMMGGQDPLMNKDSLLNGGVGVLKNFFGFGG